MSQNATHRFKKVCKSVKWMACYDLIYYIKVKINLWQVVAITTFTVLVLWLRNTMSFTEIHEQGVLVAWSTDSSEYRQLIIIAQYTTHSRSSTCGSIRTIVQSNSSTAYREGETSQSMSCHHRLSYGWCIDLTLC